MPVEFSILNQCCREVTRLAAEAGGVVRGPGSLFAAAYIHLADEHNYSVSRLAAEGHYASASALLRPFVEAMARHYWFSIVASKDQVEAFRGGKELPGVSKIVQSLQHNRNDVASQIDGMWKESRTLHDYAHGGQRQIARRFVDENVIGSAFSEQDIDGLKGICRANLLALGLAYAEQVNQIEFTRSVLEVLELRCGLPGGGSAEDHLQFLHPL